MPRNLSISVIKEWAEDVGLDVEVVDQKRAIVCMMPTENILIPLVIRLDNPGYLLLGVVVARNVQANLQLFQKALQLNSTVPAKFSLHGRDLMLITDVHLHQGFDEADFWEVLLIVKLTLDECYWPMKFIVRETRRTNDTPGDPSQGFSWPEWLLSVN